MEINLSLSPSPTGFNNLKYKWYIYHKIIFLKKDCPETERKGNYIQIKDASDLVMDPGCSYLMCPRKEYFKTLKVKEGGVI